VTQNFGSLGLSLPFDDFTRDGSQAVLKIVTLAPLSSHYRSTLGDISGCAPILGARAGHGTICIF